MSLQRRRPGAVFVDRDGVLCKNRPDHVKRWSEFEFIPGAIEAMASLTRARFPLVIVTNQAVVGRGLLTMRTLESIHARMVDSLAAAGAEVSAVMVCPHHPDDECACRKPKPGMLLEAAEELKLDLGSSFMVGDHESDIEAGAAAGCATVLVRSGRGRFAQSAAGWESVEPDFVADDLIDAAIWIMGQRAVRVAGGLQPRR
ncbi:MAG TPA: D-glycero-beta-D-manno-heptose 1,7-bisphosphate 7-phosphatase [Actinomycetota bacterium]